MTTFLLEFRAFFVRVFGMCPSYFLTLRVLFHCFSNENPGRILPETCRESCENLARLLTDFLGFEELRFEELGFEELGLKELGLNERGLKKLAECFDTRRRCEVCVALLSHTPPLLEMTCACLSTLIRATVLL